MKRPIKLPPKQNKLLVRKWPVLCTFAVAGLPYADYNPEYIARGMHVNLVAEPSNPRDRKAIKVILDEGKRKLGYVPSSVTAQLHEAKKQGCSFFCMINQHFEENPSWSKVWVVVKVCYPESRQGEINMDDYKL